MCRFLGRLDDEALPARGEQASEKRQCTKSREVLDRACRGLYGDLRFSAIVEPLTPQVLPVRLTMHRRHLVAM